MTNEELQAIKVRAEAATPGPWKHYETYTRTHAVQTAPESNDCIVWGDAGVDKETDAAFIAAARADVPALVAEVERLRAIVDAAPEYAAYVYMALATLDTPMTLEEWYADGEAYMAQDGAE